MTKRDKWTDGTNKERQMDEKGRQRKERKEAEQACDPRELHALKGIDREHTRRTQGEEPQRQRNETGKESPRRTMQTIKKILFFFSEPGNKDGQQQHDDTLFLLLCCSPPEHTKDQSTSTSRSGDVLQEKWNNGTKNKTKAKKKHDKSDEYHTQIMHSKRFQEHIYTK
jgi:hypothetical protein